MITYTQEAATLILRAGPDHCEHGDPWEFAATVIIAGTTARVVAGRGKWRREYLGMALNLLADFGIDQVAWERRDKSGELREHKFMVENGRLRAYHVEA